MMFRISPRQSVPNSYDMYIYDDVTARGRFDWNTWKELESETSNKYFREKLAQIPGDATINLYINSNGGEVKEGVGIYNQLKRHGATVNGVVDGNAYSVAFLILMACDHRTMNLGTSALVHNMWTIVAGNANDLRKEADALDKLMESNRQIFLDACGGKITEEKLIELMNAETFLTPDECLEYGFIDEVNRQALPEDDEDEDEEEKAEPETDDDETADDTADTDDDTADDEEDPDDDKDEDDDEDEDIKALKASNRELKKQLSRLMKQLQPVKPMDPATVNNLVAKYFK
jgi:ATP-dependent protease ClpP protease subunit